MILRVLGDRYRLLERIGGGGMATVYRGEDVLLGRKVAVKLLKPQLVVDEDFASRFRHEARAAASLSHSNIVSVYDVGQEDGTPYIVMEYVEGMTLKDLIRQKGRLSPGEAAHISIRIARALEHAHAAGLVHRDIKPQNILVAGQGRVKVTDFGIAGVTTEGTVTFGTEAIVGSVTYFSPEQARGEKVGVTSDLYSLGVVLYEMLAGQPPFAGDGPFGVALMHLQVTPRPLREIVPEVPADLEAIVERAMAKPAEHRYPSAGDMRRALEAVARRFPPAEHLTDGDEFPTVVPPAHRDSERGRREPTMRRGASKRRGWRVRSARAVLIVVIGLLAVGGYLGFQALREWWLIPEVIVPDVLGTSLVAAERRLEEFRLTGRVVGEQFHEEAPPGEVLRQNPQAGERVREGRAVELWISKGRELVEAVPGVVGLPVREARLRLSEAGLRIGSETSAYNLEVPADHVIAQNPVAGTEGLVRGAPVYLQVSLGPEPVALILPDFRGELLETVRQRLRELELVEGTITEQEGPGNPGTVGGQTPAPGTAVASGSPIDLVVIRAPAQPIRQVIVTVEVPDAGPERQDVRVAVIDRNGQRTRIVFRQDDVPAGTRLRTLVDYEGEVATIRILIEGMVVREYEVR
ncbi:MAG TPA: Stk1 family PASTA domain-containing Ser/Thr kinase [Clostridiales bacterium]|nr:Stk1 family PASTA domain-containing Ser/Thr kinase [Clostridiales bacterium]